MTSPSRLRHNAHAVIIGIDTYRDQKISDLQYARADAEGVYQILTDPELGRIPRENVILLLNEQATARNIRVALGTDIPRRANENDLVYIYYAGHGSPVIDPKSRSRDGMEKYLVPADAEVEHLRATGIAMDEIQKFFGYIESKQVMFFIDSCYSGEAGGRTFQDGRFRKRDVHLTGEFLDDLASEGRMVVTACDVNEVSLETPDLGHGLFTHYLMEGLKGIADKDQDGLVTIHELYDYVYENVSQHARQLGGSMHPIQKGAVKGKIFLTQYETPAQKEARPLHQQAQEYFDAGKFDEAYELWQKVIKLAPQQESAQRGLAEIASRRKEEMLVRQQRTLLDLRRAGKLPVDEFNAAMSLIEKNPHELAGLERELREFLDDLLGGKISPENYLKSIRLRQWPVAPKEKEISVAPKPVQKKPAPVKAKEPSPEAELVPTMSNAVVLTFPLPQPIVSEKQNNVVSNSSRKWLFALAAVLLLVVVVVVIISQQEKPTPLTQKQEETSRTGLSASPITLRSESKTFSEQDVREMLRTKNFFCKTYDWNKNWSNPDGKGLENNYVLQHNSQVVFDRATGLMWQQSGSTNVMVYADTKTYLDRLNGKLNEQSLAGYTDWRLPTLEEAMSLMEPSENKGGNYINAIFNNDQIWIWTTDLYSGGGRAWYVHFLNGYCDRNDIDSDYYVRAVRS